MDLVKSTTTRPEQCQQRDVANGSATEDYKHPLILHPRLGVKQMESGAKRTLPLEGRLSGAKQTYQRHVPDFRVSATSGHSDILIYLRLPLAAEFFRWS